MIKAALIDMDGVLYDSMKYHTLAWQRMMSEEGIPCTRDEFYLYEGMTGPATINLLFMRHKGHELDADTIKKMYARKSQYFIEMGRKETMPDADRMIDALKQCGLKRVLVTGSAQQSILSSIASDYPGAFEEGMRITALDVKHGKPDPEPYLMGARLAGVDPSECIVIENAPLGVQAGHDAGAFVVAVTTGPIPSEEMTKAGADIVYSSMAECADNLPSLINHLNAI